MVRYRWMPGSSCIHDTKYVDDRKHLAIRVALADTLISVFERYKNRYDEVFADERDAPALYVLTQPSETAMVGSLRVVRQGLVRHARVSEKPVKLKIIAAAVETIRDEVRKFLKQLSDQYELTALTSGVYYTKATVAYALKQTIDALYTTLSAEFRDEIESTFRRAVDEYVNQGEIDQAAAEDILNDLIGTLRAAQNLISFLVANGYRTHYTNLAVTVPDRDFPLVLDSLISKLLTDIAASAVRANELVERCRSSPDPDRCLLEDYGRQYKQLYSRVVHGMADLALNCLSMCGDEQLKQLFGDALCLADRVSRNILYQLLDVQELVSSAAYGVPGIAPRKMLAAFNEIRKLLESCPTDQQPSGQQPKTRTEEALF